MEEATNEPESIPLNRDDYPPRFEHLQNCGNEGKLRPNAREDQITTPILDMESNDLDKSCHEAQDVVLYPAGGAFNKLRKKQLFLEQLLSQHWAEYSATHSHLKKKYVHKHILQPIRKSGRTLKIFQGSSPANGFYWIPNDDVAFDRLAQKLRDTKKSFMVPMQEGDTPAPKRPQRCRRKAETTNIDAAPPKKRRKVARSKTTSALKTLPLTTLASSSSSVISYTGREVAAKTKPHSKKAATSLVVPRPQGAVRVNRKSTVVASKEPTDPSVALQELQEVVWSQWEQIDCWRRLCARYKETNEVQRQVIRQQNAMLAHSKNECFL
jgi:hypothetical protein